MESIKDSTIEVLDHDKLDKILLKKAAEKAVAEKLKNLVHEGTFKQKSGYRLTKMIVILIGIFGLGLLCCWYFGKSDAKEVIQLAEVLIVNTLLPVLTLILGYTFGSRENQNRDV